MSTLQQAAETINAGCDRLRASVQGNDSPATVLAVIEQHRADSLRSVGVDVQPGRPADIYKFRPQLWP